MMTFDQLMEIVRPAIIEFQVFRDQTPDDQWDALCDDYYKDLVLTSLSEIEDYLF
jgi:hypothetical protein